MAILPRSPMAKEQFVIDEVGPHFALRALFGARGVAGVVLAFGINVGDKEETLAVRRPRFAVSLARNPRDLLGVGAIGRDRPDLRAAAAIADVRDALAVRRPARPRVLRAVMRNLFRRAAAGGNAPNLHRPRVRREVG